jgi:transposase
MSFALLGLVFGISGRKIYDWYRNVLSGFDDPEAQKRLHEHDTVDPALIDKETGKPKKVFVPILKPENFGENMTIDDKNIGGEGYTVISNKDTGKIAALIMSVKAGIVSDVLLKKVPTKILMAVKTVTKDLAENYDWIARTCFMNAMKIADKFHVIKLAMEALQAIRVRFRQAALTAERERREQWKKEGNKIKDLPEAESIRERRNRKRPSWLEVDISCSEFEKQWTETQAERAMILFREFPEIKEAYDLICSFRNFYKCKIGTGHRARDSLDRWYEKTKTSKDRRDQKLPAHRQTA